MCFCVDFCFPFWLSVFNVVFYRLSYCCLLLFLFALVCIVVHSFVCRCFLLFLCLCCVLFCLRLCMVDYSCFACFLWVLYWSYVLHSVCFGFLFRFLVLIVVSWIILIWIGCVAFIVCFSGCLIGLLCLIFVVVYVFGFFLFMDLWWLCIGLLCFFI